MKEMKKKAIGLTKDAGFQIGVRRTFSIDHDTAWDFLFSKEGLKVWLGNIQPDQLEVGKAFQVSPGVEGRLRIFKPGSHIRMGWKKKEWENTSTLQIRVINTKGKSTISFHQDNLLNTGQREEMKAHWEKALEKIAKLDFVKTKEKETEPKVIKSCYSHLGGRFGHALALRFEEMGWIVEDTQSKDFLVTPKGEREFKKLGVDMSNL